MDPQALDVLRADNPWLDGSARPVFQLPAGFISRTVMEDLNAGMATRDRVHLVVGPRQVGKSTLIRRYFQAASAPPLYLDCEQRVVRELCASAPLFLELVRQIAPATTPIYFDEVQHLHEAALFLKGLVDRCPGVTLVATGSSSYHLRSATRESLAGRATRTRVLPFSLAEVTADVSTRPPLIREAQARERLAKHLRFGGYPRAWLDPRPEVVLAELVEAFVLRDASDLHRVGRPDAFRRLMVLVAGQVGSLVNHSEWASLLGVNRDTVASYLQILEDSHLCFTLPPFAAGKRAEVTGRPKVFFVDVGLRNRLVGDFRPFEERVDRGAVAEQWVFGELQKALPTDATLHFWRSAGGAEMDFVVVRGDQLVAIEVKAGLAGTRTSLTRSARSFIDAYSPRELWVIHGSGVASTSTVGETCVKHIPMVELLRDPLQLERALGP